MGNIQTQSSAPDVRWQGFHHTALVTPDLDATIAFYVHTLGMEAGPVFSAAGKRGRHCFIKPGDTRSWGIHFFEYEEAVISQSSEEIKQLAADRNSSSLNRFLPGALQHVAFSLRSETDGMKLRKRLQELGVVMTDIYDQGLIRNFIFLDNNGIQLEAAWPKEKA